MQVMYLQVYLLALHHVRNIAHSHMHSGCQEAIKVPTNMRASEMVTRTLAQETGWQPVTRARYALELRHG